MQSIGTTIRAARLQAGLSLQQVSARTRISVKSLQAVEDDDLSLFSSPFFYKSFVRQLAHEVGIPYGSLLPLVEEIITAIPDPVMPGQNKMVIEKAAISPPKRSRPLRFVRPVGALIAVLALCSGLYTFWERSKAANPAEQATIKADVNQPKPVPATPPIPEDGFQVEISGLERSWLALVADGQQIFSGFLEADQTKVLRGHEVGRIRTGNAGGVSLVFNGRPIGVAGPRGQVRTVVFTKDNYQVLQPASGHTLTHDSVSLVHVLHLRCPRQTALLPLQSN